MTRVTTFATILCLGACTGNTGPAGAQGPMGDMGSQGPAGSGAGLPTGGGSGQVLTSDGAGGGIWKSVLSLTGLGIGIATPAFDVHVVESSNTGLTLERYGGTAGVGFRNAAGTQANPTGSSGSIGQLRFMGYGATGFSNSKVWAEVNAAETWTDTAQGTHLQFYSTPVGTTTSSVRLRVSTYGHIGEYSGTPTLSNCGTTPTLTNGADSNGLVTEGTAATGCTITFANAYNSAPTCTVTSRGGLSFSYTVSTTDIVITNVGALSGTQIDYICRGF